MADLVVTAANVAPQTGAGLQRRTAGANITAGMAVYIDGSGLLQLAEKDVAAANANAVGIAVCDAATGQPCVFQVSGSINIGATLVAGQTYIVGAGGGGIAPVSDAAATNFTTILGIAISTSLLKIGINASGVAHG